MKYINRYV